MRSTWTLPPAAALATVLGLTAGTAVAGNLPFGSVDGFESHSPGVQPDEFHDADTGWTGVVTVESSGTDGVLPGPAGGTQFAKVVRGPDGSYDTDDRDGPYAHTGAGNAYPAILADHYSFVVDIYTQSAPGASGDFIWQTGVNDPDTGDGVLTEAGFNITPGAATWNFNARLPGITSSVDLATNTWYTLEVVWDRSGTDVVATTNIWAQGLRGVGAPLYSASALPDADQGPEPIPSSSLGAPRYSWFTVWADSTVEAIYLDNIGVVQDLASYADPSYADTGEMIGRNGLGVFEFLVDSGANSAGDTVAVYLRAGRNKDDSVPDARAGNIFYVGEQTSSDDPPQFDFQFTPAIGDTDTAGVTDYYLRLAVDIDGSTGVDLVDITNPMFDADGVAMNSWDDIESGGDGRGDGLYFTNAASSDHSNPPSAIHNWNRTDIAYVYSQSWRHQFGFTSGPIAPGDYTIVWEVYEGNPATGGTRLAGVEGVMRVLPVGVSPISTVALTDAGDGCVNGAEQLVVNVDAQLVEDIYGGQFFMSYDTGALDVASIVPGPGLDEMYAAFDEGAGTIDYAVNRPFDAPTALSGDATLATITFNVADSICSPTADLVSFRPTSFPTPPTQLTDSSAQAVAMETSNLGPVSLDIEAPTFTVPSDITVNADAGLCSAIVDPGDVTDEADNCTTPTVTSERSDSLALSDPYPSGDTFITWTATDACGNSTTQIQTVHVNAVNDLHVDVALEGVSSTVQRCITFEVGGVEYTALVDFTGGSGSADIEVACGSYTCITARDALHTLQRTSTIAVSGTGYTASFTGADALVSGNLNGDVYIDILDFGGYAGQFADSVPVDTDCSTTPIHADFSGDGVVFTEDFTFISINFLEVNEQDCEGGFGATQPPVERISVQELRLRGDDDLARGDINHDGWLDQGDLSAFLLTGGEPCTADFNASGAVDVFDLLTYLDLWFTADPAANLAGNASVDVFDLLAFLDSWFAGCP